MNNNIEPSSSRSALEWLGHFFASHAMLCLVTLMLLFGLVLALAPIAWTYANLPAAGAGKNVVGSKGAGGFGAAGAECSRVVVSFQSAAPIAQIANFLSNLDASITHGPDENGAFELTVPAGESVAVAAALLRADALVVAAAPHRGCR